LFCWMPEGAADSYTHGFLPVCAAFDGSTGLMYHSVRSREFRR